MFHKPRWLVPGGRFHEVWLLAHGYNIDYGNSKRVDLEGVCRDIKEAITSDSEAPNQRVSLRLLSQLCAGAAKLFSLEVDLLWNDLVEINSRLNSERSQPLSENSSSIGSEYSKRSDCYSSESELDSEIESESIESETNPTTVQSLPLEAVPDLIEHSSRRPINTASNVTEAIEELTTQITVGKPSVVVEKLHLRDSDVFKKPNPPVVEEVELGLPQSIQTESGIGLSLDLPALSSQDEGTEKISQLNKYGRKDQQINLDQELKNYESSQLVRSLARENQADPFKIDLRPTVISPEHLKCSSNRESSEGHYRRTPLPENQSSYFQRDAVATSDQAGPSGTISRKSLPSHITSLESSPSKQPTHVLHQLVSEDADDINSEFGISAPGNINIRLLEHNRTSKDVRAIEKTKDIFKDHPDRSQSTLSTRSQSVPEIEYRPRRTRWSLGAYDVLINIGELELHRDVRFSSPVFNSRKRKVHSQPDVVELEVVRKQRRLSRGSQDYGSLRLTSDGDETLLVPTTEPFYMETMPKLSEEDLHLIPNAVPPNTQTNPAVIPLTLGDLEDLEPIEENYLPGPGTGRKLKTVLLKRTYTPQLPSLASLEESLQRRRVLLGMSHPDNVTRRILQMYERNMITTPREIDCEMLQKPVSSTPIHVTEAFAPAAFVPADVSFIAETFEEPGPSNIGSGSLREGSESEKETRNSSILPTQQNNTVYPSPTTPILDTAVIVGRERYWLRSDEAKRLQQVEQLQPNIGTQCQSLFLPIDKPVSEPIIRRPLSMPVLNVRAQTTRSLRRKYVKDLKRRVSCPTPNSQKLLKHGISKLKTFVCGITSLPPKIPTSNPNNSSFTKLGRSGNVPLIQTRESSSSRESNDKSNSPIAGPSRNLPSRSELHYRKLTSSNSSVSRRDTEKRTTNELGRSDNRMALIVICPENTIDVENSKEIKVMITPAKHVGEEMKTLYKWESRNV